MDQAPAVQILDSGSIVLLMHLINHYPVDEQ